MTERDADYWNSNAPSICARRVASVPSLCGAPAFTTIWTSVRAYVTCPKCIAEVERRLAEREQHRKIRS